jgi:hypothetical protein
MTDEQLEKVLNEIKESYRKQVHNIFQELSLKMKSKSHFAEKPTYYVEMDFVEWEAMETRYLSY